MEGVRFRKTDTIPMGYAGIDEKTEDRGLNRFALQTLIIAIKARQNAANSGLSTAFETVQT